MALTSTQIGAIAENLVANRLMVESDGRFSPFRPVADDEGIDLLIYDKSTGRVVPLQIKARNEPSILAESARNTTQFTCRRQSVERDKRTQLLAVLLEDNASSIRLSWLVPVVDIPRLTALRRGVYALRPSIAPTTADKYASYRHDSIASVVAAMKGRFEVFDRSWPPRGAYR